MPTSIEARYSAAGGVVVKDGQVLVLNRRRRREVRLPKGHSEPGETDEETALRETREESGYTRLQVLADLGFQRVEFRFEGRKTTREEHYFLLKAADGEPRNAPEAQFSPRWLSWSEAEEALSFPAEREWIRRARRVWSRSAGRDGLAVALSTGSLYTYGVGRAFEVASQAGYDGVEVLVDHRWDTRQPDYLRSLSERYALPIVSLHSPFVANVVGWPADELGRLRRTVDLARDLSVEIVVAHLPLRLVRFSAGLKGPGRRRSGVLLPRLGRQDYDRFLATELAGLQQRTGVQVCVENMPVMRIGGIRLNAFKRNDASALGGFEHVTLDTTHVATWGLDPLEYYHDLRERIAHIHISNYDVASRVQHQPPQTGDFNLAALVSQLRQDGYTGQLVVEANPATLGASDPAECRFRLRRALDFCRGDVRLPAGFR
jgi:sugar phosphate isomerase/epimerase/8-oxo-dGTP pyrophosphatase MutT (NUDIX family)